MAGQSLLAGVTSLGPLTAQVRSMPSVLPVLAVCAARRTQVLVRVEHAATEALQNLVNLSFQLLATPMSRLEVTVLHVTCPPGVHVQTAQIGVCLEVRCCSSQVEDRTAKPATNSCGCLL